MIDWFTSFSTLSTVGCKMFALLTFLCAHGALDQMVTIHLWRWTRNKFGVRCSVRKHHIIPAVHRKLPYILGILFFSLTKSHCIAPPPSASVSELSFLSVAELILFFGVGLPFCRVTAKPPDLRCCIPHTNERVRRAVQGRDGCYWFWTGLSQGARPT